MSSTAARWRLSARRPIKTVLHASRTSSHILRRWSISRPVSKTVRSRNTVLPSLTLTDFAIAICDVNGLKAINDTLGHEAGDAYIKEGCMLICHKFDHSPVFRIGGDEFVAILKGRDYENREELEGSFRQMIDENQRNGKVVVASGMAIYTPGSDESYNDVFKRADEMMYKRKQELKAMK